MMAAISRRSLPLLLFLGAANAISPVRTFVSKARGGKVMSASLDEDVVDPTSIAGACDADVVSRSGYFDVAGSAYDTNADKSYYFWAFESRNDPATDPVVLWLTGGPGCSSTLALLSENGPCSITADGAGTATNPASWNSNATVIWLDQPAGVGFSYGTMNDNNEDMVGEDAYYFLQNFFADHPEYASQPFFVFGESFGGHYAPGVAHAIFEKNKDVPEGAVRINLSGLGIGNGLTDPVTQYQYYAEMAMNNTYGIKTVSEEAYASMVAHIPACVQTAEACQDDSSKCHTSQTLCSLWETTPYYETGLNPYDIRIPCEVPGLCYNFSNVETFLANPAVLEALHVRTDKSAAWTECNCELSLVNEGGSEFFFYAEHCCLSLRTVLFSIFFGTSPLLM
jgi:cathepsin A (carboxypeptidase C)